MKIRKLLSVCVITVAAALAVTGCSSENTSSGAASGAAGSFDAANQIAVISREEGSGTRDAFVELTGVLTEDEAGNETDNTTVEASVIDGTQAVMTSVAGNDYAIGYISLGSLNETVKAVKVDGVEPTEENIKAGDYVISRPFNIATKSDLSEQATDFMNYILSPEGQEVVAGEGYISIDDTKEYESNNASGKVVVAGSSSVSPVMEKLIEAYESVNPNVTVELQTTDSSAGMQAASEGTCDIGMASRELKEEELANLTGTQIAVDGIAVIVNNNNTTDDLSLEQIRQIFTGEVTAWDAL